MDQRIPRLLCASVLAVALAAAAAPTAWAEWKPERTVELVVPSGPGGGNDQTARVLQEVWQQSGTLTDVVVVNKPGGGGAVSYAYTQEKTGDPHYLSVARTGLLSNKIIGRSPITHADMTPIAMVRDDIMALAVKADSPIKSIGDMVEMLKKDPKSISIALGSSRGSTTEFLVAKIANAAGVDPKQLNGVTFSGSTESVTNLIGGHVDMVSVSIAALVEFHKAGQIRIIGLASEKRPASLPDIPTVKEQGYDVVQGGWFAIVGPPGLTDEQVAYWEARLKEASETPAWHKMNVEYYVDDWFLGAAEAKAYLDKDYKEVEGLLTDLGLVQ